jgi:4-hydroxy-2-oxoheptanedioate aldolase
VRKNRIKELWHQGKPAVMGWCSTGNPYIAELMANVGYDGLVIDWQHGVGVSQSSVVACIQAIGNTDTVPIVRLPKNEPDYISYVLDAGAYGVIVPMVNTIQDATRAGRACRYAPQGNRSIAANRPTLSTSLGDYVAHANDEVICLVMIETREALKNVEEIATAPLIDGLYIGPSDLSLDMGVNLSTWPNDERHLEASRKVLAAAKAAGVVPCHHGAGPAEAAQFMEMGFMLCQIGSDVKIMSGATAAGFQTFKDALQEKGMTFHSA